MKLAVIRVRGPIRIRHDFVKAMELLGLINSNNCVIVEDSPDMRKKLLKIKDYCTWGVLDEKTLAELNKKGSKIIRLNPPKKGFGRKGVKIPFKLGGALGDRGEKINDLIMRML
ncbi:uL30 family ribosomal protein [Candidatus Woesearchaeota archaeon]|nr:uL30 family ribosomal protein [Candidatus Woesearchaeota archaeon]